MNKEEAINRFIKENLKELTDSKATKQLVKILRQSYFTKHNLLSASHFSNWEVANKLAQQIATLRKSQNQNEVVETIFSIPFVKDELSEKEIEEIVSMKRLGLESTLKPEDLRKIREEDYLTSVEEELRKKAEADTAAKFAKEKEELKKLNDELEQKKLALDNLKSELDSIPPSANLDSLIQDENQIQADHPVTIWWKEMGLESDPFSSNQGLSGIPESKYENVVVQTPFIKPYIDKLTVSPKELFGKTIVFLGEYGSGKTTVIQMVAYKASRIGIFPVMIFMNPQSPNLTAQFIAQISESVKKASHNELQEEQFPARSVDDIGYGIKIMETALKVKNPPKGFLICVDGLHKPEIYLKQSLGFLQQLQGFQERLSSANIPCGIFVTGSLSWETELVSNPSLSGSFYSVEKLPVLAENYAVEAVIRRINSFVPPGGSLPTIVRSPLRYAFQTLSKRLLRPPTFRDYLDHVRDRFVARDYANVGIKLSLHMETIETVQREILKTNLKESYERLTDPNQHTKRFRFAIRIILPQVLIQKGITESDRLFRENRGAFKILQNEGFIVYMYNAERDVLAWHLSSPIVDFLTRLYRDFKIPTEDALEAMFSERIAQFTTEAETPYVHIRNNLRDMVASWRPGWPEVANLLDKVDKQIELIEKSTEASNGQLTTETLDNFSVSLQNLMRAVAYVLGDSKALNGEIVNKFVDLWCAPENVDVWINLVKRNISPPTNPSQVFGMFHTHSQAVSDILALLTELVRGEGVTRLSNRQITSTEALKLHTARTRYLSQQYAESVDAVREVVEIKVRDIVFTTSRCAFGDEVISHLPEDIQKQVSLIRGHPRAKRNPDINFLYNISRSEYSKIIFQKDFVKILFKDRLNSTELKNLKDRIELIFSLADRDAHKDRPSFFREHATEIHDCLEAAPRICEILNSTISDILEGDEFYLRKSTNSTVTFGFGDKKWGFKEFEIGGVEIGRLVPALLQSLEGGYLIFPPLEEITNLIEGTIESEIAIMRQSVVQGFINVQKDTQPLCYKMSLSQKGKEKLTSLRNAK